MPTPILSRIDAQACALPFADEAAALREGEELHRAFRPRIRGDYLAYLHQMAAEGARVTQLFADGEVRALAVCRSYLTTYCGRRFEIDDLVTAEAHRSKGYGATLIKALESSAREQGNHAMTLSSAVHRKEAHRFYFRQRYTIEAFLFGKPL
jgi:GNAT superfamily N-acetyltransferase